MKVRISFRLTEEACRILAKIAKDRGYPHTKTSVLEEIIREAKPKRQAKTERDAQQRRNDLDARNGLRIETDHGDLEGCNEGGI